MIEAGSTMRVAFIADKLDIGGGGSNFSLDLIARTLHDRGHNVVVHTVHFAHDNDLPDDRPYEVQSEPLDDDSQVGKARAAAARINRLSSSFDILHVFNPALVPSAGWATRNQTSAPVVGRLNTYDVFCTNLARMDGNCHNNCTVGRKFAHSERSLGSNAANLPEYAFDTYGFPRLANNLDRLFAISPQVVDVFTGIGIDNRRIRVIPNFYDPAFGSNDSEPLSFDYERTALYAGALKEYKGVHLLVDALQELPEEYGVVLAGDGPARESFERRARNLDVRDRVTFAGWVDHDDLPQYYWGTDAFVHPGLWPEPFGRTILEALQCDCPPVVSDVGAPPWIVGDAGLVFERDDPQDLANQLESVFEAEAVLDRLANRRSDRLAQFTPDRTVSLLEEQYRQVMSDNR